MVNGPVTAKMVPAAERLPNFLRAVETPRTRVSDLIGHERITVALDGLGHHFGRSRKLYAPQVIPDVVGYAVVGRKHTRFSPNLTFSWTLVANMVTVRR
jgi:hypothetical protein